MESDPHCRDCGKPILPESLVFYLAPGEWSHVRCVTEVRTIKHAERQEQFRELVNAYRARREMGDHSVPFSRTGEVVAWNRTTRLLDLGHTRMEVASDVAVDMLAPRQSVTVSGHRVRTDVGFRWVTKIEAYRPGL